MATDPDRWNQIADGRDDMYEQLKQHWDSKKAVEGMRKWARQVQRQLRLMEARIAELEKQRTSGLK